MINALIHVYVKVQMDISDVLQNRFLLLWSNTWPKKTEANNIIVLHKEWGIILPRPPLGYITWMWLSSTLLPPSSPIWLIHSNFLWDSFLEKKRSISPWRSKVRICSIIDDLLGQTLSYLSPPDLSSNLIHHKLKLYSGGVALSPLPA